ncbi:MAG: cytidylate kinase-like family protein [Lachnospiraceae bacterium]|nr:cytidylate kinase-like family protein [Lachnospiraceae bacterium]
MNGNIVITISREYGSGGRAVGERLAKELGIEYYDKDIIKMAAEESGINEGLFNMTEEKVKAKAMSRLTRNIYTGELISPDKRDFTSPENLFSYQAKIIKQLADRESCIVVGRCADFILEGRDNVVRVFIHAPKSYRLSQAEKRMSLSPKELDRYVDKVNHEREVYYEHFTGRKWSDAHHFDLCLDVSRLGVEKCVEIIKGYMKVRFEG